ncbi:MAG TPA: aconitate hydratase AcnA [Kiritimatiellia bacterium]|nr:aconitate hydratase AcnA [Kiritimatiellia bacterium]HSA18139.1 aconitate hydratase AcnA [Kiritimatiellia bacterium]
MNHEKKTLDHLTLKNGRTMHFHALADWTGEQSRLPFSIRVLLESVLRRQGHPAFRAEHVRALARWTPDATQKEEVPFLPARVLLQDFTGVPCVVDLAALRGAMARAGRDPKAIEPQIPVDLVIDHSVQVDETASPGALEANMRLEFERNAERYEFLRWGQTAFRKLRVVPPGLGICHQVNLEHLAQVVATETDAEGRVVAFPDTLVGTDSHTTMINGAGVLGWGVGGIEAEAAMLGQPIPVLTPVVTGVRLTGRLAAGVTATELALTVTQLLRKHGVVEQFVEYFGPGLDTLSLADRATVANMAPEYGATMGFFPVDAETLRYLRETGRDEEQVELVEQYCRRQGLFRRPGDPEPAFSRVIELDLGSVEAGVAGPKRPHDRLALEDVAPGFRKALAAPVKEQGYGLKPEQAAARVRVEGDGEIGHGAVVVASITSCTNTSNPGVMLAAGLVARKAVERGLTVPPHVKTTLAPGSRVVTAYLRRAGLLPAFEQLGFHVAAYGCATCIGNSGPLDPRVAKAVKDGGLVAAAVLSGNRNFEGRVHPLTKANYLCSPPLVVAYALAGTVDRDLSSEPLGRDAKGRPVFLKDLWPSPAEVEALLGKAADPALYRELYADIAGSNPAWNKLSAQAAPVFGWKADSTYIREPSFIADIPAAPEALGDIRGARALALFGDFITTDHISPAGSIPADSPAGRYLQERGIPPAAFNSYGARRGNHEVMVRGTFANIRIRNRMVDREGGWTRLLPGGESLPIYDAAMRYAGAGTPLVVLAGKMYGAGSSRDWAAKGTRMLGVRAVIAESFERIHRSNLVEMGVLPLEFTGGQNAEKLGLTGREEIAIAGIAGGLAPGKLLDVDAGGASFRVQCRIDSAIEVEYYRQGGILPYVLRQAMGTHSSGS